MLIFPLTILSLIVIVLSNNLTVLHPLDGQLPPIARVDKDYSWTILKDTFSPAAGLLYSANLPSWLSFDPQTLTFAGRPSEADEGDPRITVTAKDQLSEVSSSFYLCVTRAPEPTISSSLEGQFILPQPSISSVFPLAKHSALSTSSLALRVPPRWSFSIGFEYETCVAHGKVYYDAQLCDGYDLPEWMVFNHKALTVNGVAPSENTISQPAFISVCLICSDRESFSAVKQPFDIIISAHELSMAADSLPPINITSTVFSSSFHAADLAGVLIDGRAIRQDEILELLVDVSQHADWLRYDNTTRTLYGGPGNVTISLGTNLSIPVTLTTSYNQTLHSQVSLRGVPSYFSSPEVSPIEAAPGDPIRFNLADYFSNATVNDVVRLGASIDPSEVSGSLVFDEKTAQLTGTIPPSFTGSHILVTFTASSYITHTTSHIRVPILLAPPGQARNGLDSKPGGRSAMSRTRLVLGLSIAFGVFGGLCLFFGLLAVFRKWARTPDTALEGEEGRTAWSEQDQKWYSQGVREAQEDEGWTEPAFVGKQKPSLDYRAPSARRDDHGVLGLGLQRVTEGQQESPGVMSKRDFVKRIKHTMRVVSDKANIRKVPRQRPLISQPILPDRGSAGNNEDYILPGFTSQPSDGTGMQSHPGSTIMSDSPSVSTSERSIPRRRADFGPPKLPASVPLRENQLVRQSSSGSTDSSTSNASTRAHTAEGVVRTVSKIIGIRGSAKTELSLVNAGEQLPAVVTARPRLVPFTSETRVPVPQLPSTLSDEAYGGLKRINSQAANVVTQATSLNGGESAQRLDPVPPPPGSLLSTDKNVPKEKPTVLRSGERFRLRVLLPARPAVSAGSWKLDVRLVSGKPCPKFLQVETGLKGSIELHGLPGPLDVGKFALGLFDEDGSCVKTVIIEVVKWR